VSQEPAPQDRGVPPPTGEGVQPPGVSATLGVRIGARLLDTLLVGIPATIVLAILGLGTGFGMRGWIGNAIVSLLWFGYFIWFETNQGATLGKKLLNLSVADAAAGGLPSMEMAAKRNLWMLLGLVPLIGGLLSVVAVIAIMITIASSPESRGFHDTFAGTAVLRRA
jgi:uncharacterized RDD family membrane protein YckC